MAMNTTAWDILPKTDATHEKTQWRSARIVLNLMALWTKHSRQLGTEQPMYGALIEGVARGNRPGEPITKGRHCPAMDSSRYKKCNSKYAYAVTGAGIHYEYTVDESKRFIQLLLRGDSLSGTVRILLPGKASREKYRQQEKYYLRKKDDDQ